MNILKIKKNDKEVIISLSSSELVEICNVLYNTKDDDKNELYYKLNSEMMIARDMCQYGHIDDFSLERIVESRKNGKALAGRDKN